MRDAAAQVLATPPGIPLERYFVSESPETCLSSNTCVP